MSAHRPKASPLWLVLAGLVALAALGRLPADGAAWAGLAAPKRAVPVQVTQTPFVFTCPTLSANPTHPPGLYPIVEIHDVMIVQRRLPNGCFETDYLLRVCVSNDGPAPSPAMRLRIQGCGVGRIEVDVPALDMRTQQCLEVPGVRVPPDPDCTMLLDPTCGIRYVRHEWAGSVAHPAPFPTCTPGPSPTATSTISPTDLPTVALTVPPTVSATVSPTAAPGSTLWLPFALQPAR
jgi:hypothetical protein